MERTAQDLQQWSNGMIGRVYYQKNDKDDKQYRTSPTVLQPIRKQDSSTVQQLHYWRSPRQYETTSTNTSGKSQPFSGTHPRVLLI